MAGLIVQAALRLLMKVRTARPLLVKKKQAFLNAEPWHHEFTAARTHHPSRMFNALGPMWSNKIAQEIGTASTPLHFGDTKMLLTEGSQQIAQKNLAADKVEPSIVEGYQNRQELATPDSVLIWLKSGNQRFATGHANHGGYSADAFERAQVASISQRPLAAVLACIDSRTSPELVFDTSVGDLFTARVGANVVNDDILGSLEIAVESGAKVLVILGHTDCGGVKGACSNLHFGHMTQLLARVKPAIKDANDWLDKNPSLSLQVGDRVVSNRKYIAEVSHMNARKSAREILKRSPLLGKHILQKDLLLISAIYDVQTQKVLFDEPLRP